MTLTLTFDLLTLKVVSESRVTRATSVPILVFLGLCSRLKPDVRDRRQIDVRRQTASSLNAPPRGRGHNKKYTQGKTKCGIRFHLLLTYDVTPRMRSANLPILMEILGPCVVFQKS